MKKSFDIIVDRIDINTEFSCFKTKTTKKKIELGRINKTILDNIHRKLFETTKINQWKNKTKSVA